MSVRNKTTRLELTEKIHQVSKTNQNDYQIKITCKWPVARGHYQVVVIADDEYTLIMLDLYPSVNTCSLCGESLCESSVP